MRGSRYRRCASGRSVALCALGVLLLLAGCLPSSCRRTESTSLLPSDSLSRGMAAEAPVDTLRLVWSASGSGERRLEYPRTVRFGRADTLFVADVERGSLFRIRGGRVLDEADLRGVVAPYLAGVSGDSAAVFSPASLTFYRYFGGRLIDSTTVEDAGRERTSLVYGEANERLYYKRVDPEAGGFITAVTPDGTTPDTTWLRGAHWRHAGLLKMWGDTLVSLSGFRPVVDLISPARDGRLPSDPDTLALAGFDSPMLARSRSFMKGDVHEAPLLSSSAAPVGDLLFVLNMRAGWLQVDVFGRDGVLQQRLIGLDADYRSSFYPQDIDVRRSDQGFQIAVAYSEPEPAVKLYLWKRPGGVHDTANAAAADDPRRQ